MVVEIDIYLSEIEIITDNSLFGLPAYEYENLITH